MKMSKADEAELLGEFSDDKMNEEQNIENMEDQVNISDCHISIDDNSMASQELIN